jgi:hypothetical protein
VSTGAIAMTAILVSGTEGLALIAAGTWLVHHKRILLAATPKPQAQQQDKGDAGQKDKTVDLAQRRTGT